MLEEACEKPGRPLLFSLPVPGISFGVSAELHNFGGNGEKRHCELCLQGLSCAAVGLAGEEWCVWQVARTDFVFVSQNSQGLGWELVIFYLAVM